MVEKAIAVGGRLRLPPGPVEIICIDDGSTDDTWFYIKQAQRRYPHLLRPIRFAANRGKKEGLYAGFTRGRGEVFVTIDSDSIIAPDALRHLVAPLLHDGLGAVAGNVKVYNRNQSHGQDAGRALREPGLPAGLSIPLPDGGLHPRVAVGLPAHRPDAASHGLAASNLSGGALPPQRRPGPDQFYPAGRPLHLLSADRPGVYPGPRDLPGVCRMYLRWERGNVRESLVQLGYLFTRYREKYRLLPIVEFFLAQLEYPLTLLFFGCCWRRW